MSELGLEGVVTEDGKTASTTDATPTTSNSTGQSSSPNSSSVATTESIREVREGATDTGRKGSRTTHKGEGGDSRNRTSHEDESVPVPPRGDQVLAKTSVSKDIDGDPSKESLNAEDKKKKKKKKKKAEDTNPQSVADSQTGDSPVSEATPTATSISAAACKEGIDKSVGGPEPDAAEGGEETIVEEDKKKKKKKKKKEEEKKPSKGPGKSAISKIKKMQALLEEEKLKREQEALAAEREAEERERARLEKVTCNLY